MTDDGALGRQAGRLNAVRGRLEGEVGRRLVHASGAGVPLLYVLLGVEWRWIRWGLVAGVAAVAALELARLHAGLEWWAFEHLTREYEEAAVAGYALYVIGMGVVATAFEPHVAVPAMLMLAVADPVGGVLGGGEPATVKRPRAIVGALLVSVAVGLPFLPPAAAVAAAGAASLADGVFLQVGDSVVDDNLSIPIAAAVAAKAVLVAGVA